VGIRIRKSWSHPGHDRYIFFFKSKHILYHLIQNKSGDLKGGMTSKSHEMGDFKKRLQEGGGWEKSYALPGTQEPEAQRERPASTGASSL
jgi:hypothetical protein